ncbi:MAG: zinc-ribbon domain-containing protein [Gemmatimonadaceae bacterium]
MNVSCPDCRSIFRVDPAKVPPAGVRARCSVCSGVISIPAPTGQSTPAGVNAFTSSPAGAPPQQERPRAASTPVPTATGWDAAAGARPRTQPGERSPITATATPPSPASGLPEFNPPVAPPYAPRATAPPPPAAPSTPFGPPATGPIAGPSVPPFVPSQPGFRAPTPARPPVTPPAAVPSTPPIASVAASATASPAASEGGARRPLNPFLSKDPNQRAKRLARALVSDIITYHPAKHAEGLRDGTLKQLFREEIKKSFEEYIAQVGQQLAESTTYFQEALNEVLGAGKKIF